MEIRSIVEGRESNKWKGDSMDEVLCSGFWLKGLECGVGFYGYCEFFMVLINIC